MWEKYLEKYSLLSSTGNVFSKNNDIQPSEHRMTLSYFFRGIFLGAFQDFSKKWIKKLGDFERRVYGWKPRVGA